LPSGAKQPGKESNVKLQFITTGLLIIRQKGGHRPAHRAVAVWLAILEMLTKVDADENTENAQLESPQGGSTVLNCVHQAMIPFAAGQN
jgi:hypothetical protein